MALPQVRLESVCPIVAITLMSGVIVGGGAYLLCFA